MPTPVWIGLGGVAVMIAAGVIRRKARRRWAAVAASLVALAGWGVMVQFLIKPLVSGPALAVIILGGIAVTIFLTAIVGSRAKQVREGDDSRSTCDTLDG